MALITRLFEGVASRLRVAFYRALGMRIGDRVSLRRIEARHRPQTIALEEGVMLDRGVILLATNDRARIRLGRLVYVNRHTMFDAAELVEIGDGTMIGPLCYITDHDHAFGPGIDPGAAPLITAPVRIGARCWIGASVCILKGVTIGTGTVVGAGSVVTKSLPAGVVAAGQPARVLRTLTDNRPTDCSVLPP